MKARIASTWLVTLTLAIGGTAMAQDRGHRDDGPGDRHDAPHMAPARGPGGPGPDRRQEARHDDHGGPGERGAGPDHNWQRGNRLPTEYRSHQYVVDDWRGHHLSAPPRGYHWVQAGPDYVLAAVATGVIAQILLGN